MAGPKKSKNSRATFGGGNAKTQLPREISLLIPCNAGKNAYIYDTATGKNPNLATNSSAFTDAVKANVADGYGPRILAELEALAHSDSEWAATLNRLNSAEVFALPA